MAWFECHEQVRDEVKLHRLAEQLDIRYAEAVGLAVCLWAYATGYARNGNISDLSQVELARECRWFGDPNILKNSFLKCRLITSNGRIHKWRARGVKLLESKRKRMSSVRKQGRHSDTTIATPLPPKQPYQPTNQPKDIKTTAAGAADSSQAALNAYIPRVTALLKHKQVVGAAQIARSSYAQAVRLLRPYPERLEPLLAEIAGLPVGMESRDWYAQAIHGKVQQQLHEADKPDAGTIKAVLQAASKQEG